MQIIPLQAVANQSVTVQLDGQNTQIDVYQTAYGIFVDVYLDNTLIRGGVIAENLNLMMRGTYQGFSGDLAFIDNQGSSDPDYTGLGDRFSLAYLTASEILV